MKSITRTITTSIVNCSEVKVSNKGLEQKALTPFTIIGENVNEGNVDKFIKKEYGTIKNIVCVGIEKKEVNYSLSVDDFIKYATEDKKEVQETKTETANPVETK